MKGEFLEPKNETPNMFSKLHHPQNHPNHLNQNNPLQTYPFTHPFQLIPTRDSQTSEEDDANRSSGPPTAATTQKYPSATNSADGATIEVVRRPRGRPPGSKNKPKPPVIIARDTEPAMSPYILEVPGGNDVIEAIARFCRRKNTGLCVLTGSGTIANVTLRQPSTTPGATVTFHGRFDILSISATFLPHTASFPVPNGFTISLDGPQGQIVGGLVAGELIAVGTVFVIAASFNNPLYHRLPDEDEVRNSGSVGGGGEGKNSPPSSVGGESGGHAPSETCGLPMYTVHVPPSDVVWSTSSARQQPSPYQ